MSKCWNCAYETTGQYCSRCGNTLSLAVRQTSVIDHPTPTSSVRSVPTALQDMGHGNVTNRATLIQNSSDESMVWEESPSLVLLSGPATKYFFVMVFAVAIASNIPV